MFSLIKVELILLCCILILKNGQMSAVDVANNSCTTDSKSYSVPDNYNILEAPTPVNGGPTRVNISIVVTSIREVDELGEKLTLELHLRMYWVDPRLSFWADFKKNNDSSQSNVTTLNPKILQQIWQPDVFIANAISISRPTVTTPAASLRILPGGILRYSTRLAITMAYTFDYRFFPADHQECRVQIKSYAYKKHLLELAWRVKVDSTGITMAKGVNVHSFALKLEKPRKFNFRTYSALEFTLSMKRSLSYQIVGIYIPSLVFVIISWLAFLMPIEHAPERIACSMVTLLSLIVLLDSIGKDLPPVSYLTALHVWMLVSIIFVFGSLIEFILIFKLKSIEESLEECNDKDDFSKRRRLGLIQWIHKFEKWAAVLLPLLFVFFNLIYWPWLLFGQRDHSLLVDTENYDDK